MERKQLLPHSALFYADKMGWPVFPCKPQAKEPLTLHGCKDAVTDADQIRAWWKQWPAANIGAVTGVKFWVLDIDPRNGGEETLEELIVKHGPLPDTVQQITGGGGRHFLFALPEKFQVRNGHLGQGIDVKGVGGYIIVAPSVTKQAYVWDGARPITEQTIHPAPRWLLEALNAQNGHSGEPLKLPKQIRKGQQHSTLFKLGASMRAKGCEEGEIFAALWEMNQSRCEEPGPRENIEKLAASICEQYEAGSSVKTPIPEPPEGQDAPLPDEPGVSTPPPPGEAQRPATSPFVSQESLVIYHADYPEPEPIIDAILYPGLTILGGRPKVGKSWLALQLGLAVVSGQDFGGYLAVKKPGRCLFLSLEERPRQTRSRLHMLTQPADCMADLWFAYDLIPLMAGGAAVLDQQLAAHPVEVMIVDSLLAVTKQAGRKGVDLLQTDYNIVNTLRQVAEKHSLAVVLIAHTRKAPGDFLDSIQGTTGTTAAADAVWVLNRTPDGEANLSVTGREIRTNVFGLKRTSEDQPAWIITGEGDEVSQSEARRELIELLRDQGPMRLTGIARAVHKNVGGVQRLLHKLCEAGLVVRTHHGTYQISAPER